MNLILAIAALCQVHTGDVFFSTSRRYTLECQQYYMHCVSVKRVKSGVDEALERCILEKKLDQ